MGRRMCPTQRVVEDSHEILAHLTSVAGEFHHSLNEFSTRLSENLSYRSYAGCCASAAHALRSPAVSSDLHAHDAAGDPHAC